MNALSGKKILLGITAGIAAYKIPFLVRELKKRNTSVKVIMTETAKDFVSPLVLSTLSQNPVFIEFQDEHFNWNNHVKLSSWADAFVIAPLTANTLSKMADGHADNLLLAAYLSASCPVFIAPAMDLDMYQHTTTKQNLSRLEERGNIIIPARFGELASGLVGEGRMAEPIEIVEILNDYFTKNLPLLGKRVLITAGPTYEPLDPVRYIGNYSSGKMGLELAKKALSMGATVDFVIGPNSLEIPNEINTYRVTTALEMLEKASKLFGFSNYAIFAAAVSDYRPDKYLPQKMKKIEDDVVIRLIKNPDILTELASKKAENQVVVGFALETENSLENAQKKLKEKKCDWLILNELSEISGFSVDTNKITVLSARSENITTFEVKSKAEVATDIWSVILNQR